MISKEKILNGCAFLFKIKVTKLMVRWTIKLEPGRIIIRVYVQQGILYKYSMYNFPSRGFVK